MSKVTFGKMEQPAHDYDGEMLAYRNGEIVAEIIKVVEPTYSGSCEYRADCYTVEFHVAHEVEDEERYETKYFNVTRRVSTFRRTYQREGEGTARQALTAAKNHIRTTLAAR